MSQGNFSVPEHTLVNSQEHVPDRFVVPFAPELVEFILAGQKVTTYRFGDKYDYLSVGDDVWLQDSVSKKLVAKAQITAKSTTTFADLPTSNGTHESYRDKAHQRSVLSGYYAYLGREIRDDDPFLVFEFRLIP